MSQRGVTKLDRTIGFWTAIGVAGFCLLPWYTLEESRHGMDMKPIDKKAAT